METFPSDLDRHRSFSFQEFSQRYADVRTQGEEPFEPVETRVRNPGGNRQGSIEGTDPVVPDCYGASRKFEGHQEVHASYVIQSVTRECLRAYGKLLDAGVAPECARMVLPLCTATTIYMKGSIRSWIHYLDIRTDSHAQKEHREVAQAIRQIFVEQLPITSKALSWI